DDRRAEVTLRARIDHLYRTICGLGSFWQGPDAEAFRSAWSTVHHEAVASLLERLRRSAEELSRHVDEQEHASAADGGGPSRPGRGTRRPSSRPSQVSPSTPVTGPPRPTTPRSRPRGTRCPRPSARPCSGRSSTTRSRPTG